jgi:hypothetical protein
MRRTSLLALGVLLCAAACTGSPAAKPTAAPAPSSAPASAAVTPGCHADSVTSTGMGLEIRGVGQGATLYGLLMPISPLPVRTGQELKIVWRMTGSGPLRLSYTGPHGERGTLAWGPEPHGGSNYDRPGEEWGAGYTFPTAGCWRLHAERTSGSADAWLPVRAR